MYNLKNKELINLTKGKHHDGGGLYYVLQDKERDYGRIALDLIKNLMKCH